MLLITILIILSRGDRRPTLQPVCGVTYEPSLPKGMRRACGREVIRLERRRGVGALLRSAQRVTKIAIIPSTVYIRG